MNPKPYKQNASHFIPFGWLYLLKLLTYACFSLCFFSVVECMFVHVHVFLHSHFIFGSLFLIFSTFAFFRLVHWFFSPNLPMFLAFFGISFIHRLFFSLALTLSSSLTLCIFYVYLNVPYGPLFGFGIMFSLQKSGTLAHTAAMWMAAMTHSL